MIRGRRVVVILNDLVRLAFNKKVRFEQRLQAGEGDKCSRSRGRALQAKKTTFRWPYVESVPGIVKEQQGE